MKKFVSACFLIFISVLFLGTSARFVCEAVWYEREEGLKRGVFHIWDIGNTLESSCQEKLIGRSSIININGFFCKATGSNAVPSVKKENSVYRLKNDYIAFIVHEFQKFNKDQTDSIDMTVKAADEVGAELLFVSIPPKVCSEDDFILKGIKNREYEIIEYRLKYFESHGFETLNLHEKLHEQNLDHYSLFYRTDHHWNADAGLWASKEVANRFFEKGYNVTPATFSKENYDDIMIENLFLGSQGKQVGIYYAGVDDFKYYVPAFDTDYFISYKDEVQIVRNGTFEKTLFDEEKLAKDYFNGFNYSSFLGGDFELTKIRNNLKEDGPKVLMIKDSFTNVFASYFAAECSELHLIDPRYYKNSVSEYIRENNFDAVIVMLSARMTNDAFCWEK